MLIFMMIRGFIIYLGKISKSRILCSKVKELVVTSYPLMFQFIIHSFNKFKVQMVLEYIYN
jgi:hypothetical protein